MTPPPYPTILADPPWPFEYRGGVGRRNGRGEERRWRFRKESVKSLPYPTMTIDAICGLPVPDLAAADAHLYLWIPDRLLIEGVAARVIDAWGFKIDRSRLIIWKKTGFGLGTFPRPQHEVLVVSKRGKLPFQIRDAGSVHEWKLVYEGGGRKHSAKPDGAQDLIERASPGPYLELFARRQRLGWDTWGNEALEHVEIET